MRRKTIKCFMVDTCLIFCPILCENYIYVNMLLTCLPVCVSISIGTCTQRTITVRDFCLNYIFWNKIYLTEESHVLTVPEAKKLNCFYLKVFLSMMCYHNTRAAKHWGEFLFWVNIIKWFSLSLPSSFPLLPAMLCHCIFQLFPGSVCTSQE